MKGKKEGGRRKKGEGRREKECECPYHGTLVVYVACGWRVDAHVSDVRYKGGVGRLICILLSLPPSLSCLSPPSPYLSSRSHSSNIISSASSDTADSSPPAPPPDRAQ